jgi:CubicO group peptidase (beta-lactamase class C family)
MQRFAGLLIALLALAVSGGVAAAADSRGEAVKAAFTRWADANHIKSASLVFVVKGRIEARLDRGDYTTTTPVPVASESKFITGLCVLKAVSDGKLTLKSTLGDVLAGLLKAHPPQDSRAAGITIRQLLTHSSGITNDPSQGSALMAFQSYTAPSEDRQLAAALSTPLGSDPGKAYRYNNMNYAALGLVIEAVTGEGYESYCGREVLAKVGITDATLNPNWMAMGAYGGWLISAEDYVRLMAYVTRGSKLLSLSVGKWPRFALGGGASYGPGTLLRESGNGWYNAWHFGSWNAGSTAANNFGAYFAFVDGSTGVFAAYTPTVTDDQQGALDAAMGATAFR